jgi:flagellar biosynthesis/type III secretory pathway M-ring protein FliF/YscJ
MFVAISTLILFFLGVELIRYASNRNWKLIYSTYGYDEYFRIITILKSEGIKYKLDSANSMVGDSRMDRFKDSTRYDILVKKEDEFKSIQALRKNQQ